MEWTSLWDAFCDAKRRYFCPVSLTVIAINRISQCWLLRFSAVLTMLLRAALIKIHFKRHSLKAGLDPGLWTLDSGLWPLDSGLWTLDSGLWTLDSGLWTLDSGLYFIYVLYRTYIKYSGWGLGGCSRYRIYVFPLISTTFLFLKFFNQD